MDTGLDSLKTASKKVFHKAGEFLGNKIADTITKSSDHKICKAWWKFKKSWRNNYSTRKKRWNIKQIEKSIIKMEHYKISKLLDNLIVSKVSR